jgi:hypothetical protein
MTKTKTTPTLDGEEIIYTYTFGEPTSVGVFNEDAVTLVSIVGSCYSHTLGYAQNMKALLVKQLPFPHFKYMMGDFEVRTLGGLRKRGMMSVEGFILVPGLTCARVEKQLTQAGFHQGLEDILR